MIGELMNVLGILIVALLAQQPRPSSIEGIAVKAGTSEPIAKAVVELTGNNGQPNGYLDGVYGQRGPNGSGRALAIDGGQTLKDIRLAMTALGAMSGRVYDNSGEPLANVQVRALKYSYADGRRTLTLVKTDETGDRGSSGFLPDSTTSARCPTEPGPKRCLCMHPMEPLSGRSDVRQPTS
jgi:hypothetical protein